jgi:hypothetical protein
MTVRLSNFFNLTAGKTNESSFDIFYIIHLLIIVDQFFVLLSWSRQVDDIVVYLYRHIKCKCPAHKGSTNGPLIGNRLFGFVTISRGQRDFDYNFFHLMEIFFFVFDYPTAFVVLMSPRDNRISLQHVNRLLS